MTQFMDFICSNCGKTFSMPIDAARLMMKCPEKACSPKCAVELLKRDDADRTTEG